MEHQPGQSEDLAAAMLSAALEKLLLADKLLETATKMMDESAKHKKQTQARRQTHYQPVMLAEDEARNLCGLLAQLQAFSPTHRQVFEYLKATNSPLISQYRAAWQAPLFGARCLKRIRERCERALAYPPPK